MCSKLKKKKMGILQKGLFVTTTIFVVYVGVKVNDLLQVPPLPVLEETWWGPGKGSIKEDTSIEKFKISVSDEILEDLQQRLSKTRLFTPPLEGAQQNYGMNTNLLKEIVEFWKTNYDWRKSEKFLNKFPQYTTQIQGLKIHFLHVKPTAKPGIRVLPILILHGWPGSVREFYDIIPILTTPQKDRDFVFEVIAPSLPGFGFSEGTSKQGLGAAQMAVIFKNLMERLKIDRYYLQGGDLGAIITKYLATLYPEKVLGIHSNMCMVNTFLGRLKLFLGSFYPPMIVEEKYEKFIYPLSEYFSYILLETGYLHIQATKPDTLGVALNDSPVGLAAYILEKFTTGTNRQWQNLPDGGLKKKFTYTQLLDNVMIYWVTRTATTSFRLYSETFNKAHSSLGLHRIPTGVPSGCAKFINDIVYQPDCVLKELYPNMVHSSHLDGGHFAALEVPKLLAEDILLAVTKFESFNIENHRK